MQTTSLFGDSHLEVGVLHAICCSEPWYCPPLGKRSALREGSDFEQRTLGLIGPLSSNFDHCLENCSDLSS